MVSVIVCTYNRSKHLKTVLSSLAQLTSPAGADSWELILVDNNSKDDTAAIVETFAAKSGFKIRYVFETKQGLSHARNAGVRAAKGDIIAFTDDDVTVDSRWLVELVRTFERFDSMGVGGKVIPLWTTQKPAWLELSGPDSLHSGTVVSFDHGEEPRELNCAPFGANMAFKKEAFERHGFFRADFGRKGNDLILGEDTEFGMRLLRQGDRIAYGPSAIVYHPVPEDRLNKRYFQSHYFNYGKSTARMNGFPANVVRWFGVPRYLFRTLLGHICRWLFTLDPRLRFRRKLEVCERLGEIRGARHLSNELK